MLQEAIDEIVFVVQEDKEDGGYNAVCYPYGIFTQDDNIEDLRAMVADAVACRFEGEQMQPTKTRLHFVHDEVLARGYLEMYPEIN